MQIEVVAQYKCEVGESPLWHPDERKLYWVDAGLGRVRRYDPVAEVTEVCIEDEYVGGMTLQANGSLLLFTTSGAIKSWWQGDMQTVHEQAIEAPFNDVIADPLGRVYAGAKASGDHSGRIYRIDRDASLHLIADGFLQPNGFAFSLDRTRIYMTDSRRRERYVFDYDAGTGDCTNKRVFVKNGEDLGSPDGMTLDAEGFIWSAQWNGGCVIRYTPDGVEDRRFDFPVKKPSSVTFGGIDYTDVYVSSATGDDWTDDSPGAGSLFRIRAGMRGVPEFWSRVGL